MYTRKISGFTSDAIVALMKEINEFPSVDSVMVELWIKRRVSDVATTGEVGWINGDYYIGPDLQEKGVRPDYMLDKFTLETNVCLMKFVYQLSGRNLSYSYLLQVLEVVVQLSDQGNDLSGSVSVSGRSIDPEQTPCSVSLVCDNSGNVLKGERPRQIRAVGWGMPARGGW